MTSLIGAFPRGSINGLVRAVRGFAEGVYPRFGCLAQRRLDIAAMGL